MRRHWLSLGASVAAVLLTVTTVQASTVNSVGGTYAGQSVAAPTLAATCNPQNPQKTSDYLCRFRIHGTYYADPYMGTGTYAGIIVIDYRTYAPNTTYNENCAQTSGTMSYHRSGTTGKLSTALDFSNSFVCEESDPTIHDVHFNSLVSSGTGYFANVTGGSIASDGTSYPTSTAGLYNDAGHFSGSVSTS